MGFDPDNVENVMIKFGDRSGNYTEEEERAIQEYYDLIDSEYKTFVILKKLAFSIIKHNLNFIFR